MSAYTPLSSVGWLDFDVAARERVEALLRSLEEPGTLDQLGLSSVRDAFSTMLSPGTSTIQTRLRYFIFLPWIFQSLERDRIAPAQFAARLRDREARLIDCLRHVGPDKGVIGYTAGRDLKRLPSEIYWGGLGSWGLRRFSLSLADYAKRAATYGRQRPDRDDDGNVTSSSMSMWAPMPDPPADFLNTELALELPLSEVELVIDHIRRSHPRSLFAELCSAPERALDTQFPWQVSPSGFPSRLKDELHHARCFSELTVGPQHVYNILLARKARGEFGWDTAELESRELSRLELWTEMVRDRHAELYDWVDNLDYFWALIAPFGSVNDRTQEFIKVIVQRAVADPERFVDDTAVELTIRSRELQLKANRARLVHRSALESWNGLAFGGQLDYRWGITQRYLSDIATAFAAGS
jgi:hypothetical protein